MATAQLLRYLLVGACAQGLAIAPAHAACPPSSPPLPEFLAGLQEVPAAAVTMPADGEAAQGFDLLSRRLHARLDDCKQRYLKGHLLTAWGRWRARVENQKIEAGLVKLLERYPDDLQIGDAINQLYRSECVAPATPSPVVLNVLTVADNPVRLGLRLGGTGNESWGASTRILFAALALRPTSAPLWMQAANQVRRHDWRIALTTEGVESLAASGGGSPNECESRIIATGAESELELELKIGLLARATRRLARLPAEVGALIAGGTTGGVEGNVGATHIEGQLRDFRLDLALLELAAGHPDGAAPLLKSARPEEPAPATTEENREAKDAREEAQTAWDFYRVLTAWHEPSPQDPFELLLTGLDSTRTYARSLGLAALARRERYPAIAAYLEEPVADGLRDVLADSPLPLASGASWLPAMPTKPAPAAPAPADAEIVALDQEITSISQHLYEDLKQCRAEVRAALAADPAQRTAVSRALSALIEHVYVREGFPRPTGDERDIWIGEPQLFAHLEPAQPQVLAWTPRQLAAGEAKYGTLDPHILQLFVLDRTGHHGYAIWTTSRWGGTVRLEEVDGEWEAKEVGNWIS